eukprot:9485416-Pyramimonas_sp.AAC.1
MSSICPRTKSANICAAKVITSESTLLRCVIRFKKLETSAGNSNARQKVTLTTQGITFDQGSLDPWFDVRSVRSRFCQ